MFLARLSCPRPLPQLPMSSALRITALLLCWILLIRLDSDLACLRAVIQGGGASLWWPERVGGAAVFPVTATAVFLPPALMCGGGSPSSCSSAWKLELRRVRKMLWSPKRSLSNIHVKLTATGLLRKLQLLSGYRRSTMVFHTGAIGAVVSLRVSIFIYVCPGLSCSVLLACVHLCVFGYVFACAYLYDQLSFNAPGVSVYLRACAVYLHARIHACDQNGVFSCSR